MELSATFSCSHRRNARCKQSDNPLCPRAFDPENRVNKRSDDCRSDVQSARASDQRVLQSSYSPPFFLVSYTVDNEKPCEFSIDHATRIHKRRPGDTLRTHILHKAFSGTHETRETFTTLWMSRRTVAMEPRDPLVVKHEPLRRSIETAVDEVFCEWVFHFSYFITCCHKASGCHNKVWYSDTTESVPCLVELRVHSRIGDVHA